MNASDGAANLLWLTSATSVAAAAVAYGVANWVRANASRLGLVQAPTSRSSHVRPTPAGGGVGVVAGGALAALALGLVFDAPTPWWIALMLSLLIAAIGLWDDMRALSARLRLAAQALAWILAMSTLEPPPLSAGGAALLEGPALWLLLTVAALWWINLFNFMDGIDGIAGVQAVFMLVAGALLPTLAGSAGGAPLPMAAMLAVAAACLGFLALNWPPARIFMGDVGSTYLGFVIAAFALITIGSGAPGEPSMSYASWAILAALFVSDATITLLRRLLRGERVYQAHRSHAYQRLSRRWGGHKPVTRLALAINLLWLAPLAWTSVARPDIAWPLAALAYAPLILGAILTGAGRAADG